MHNSIQDTNGQPPMPYTPKPTPKPAPNREPIQNQSVQNRVAALSITTTPKVGPTGSTQPVIQTTLKDRMVSLNTTTTSSGSTGSTQPVIKTSLKDRMAAINNQNQPKSPPSAQNKPKPQDQVSDAFRARQLNIQLNVAPLTPSNSTTTTTTSRQKSGQSQMQLDGDYALGLATEQKDEYDQNVESAKKKAEGEAEHKKLKVLFDAWIPTTEWTFHNDLNGYLNKETDFRSFEEMYAEFTKTING